MLVMAAGNAGKVPRPCTQMQSIQCTSFPAMTCWHMLTTISSVHAEQVTVPEGCTAVGPGTLQKVTCTQAANGQEATFHYSVPYAVPASQIGLAAGADRCVAISSHREPRVLSCLRASLWSAPPWHGVHGLAWVTCNVSCGCQAWCMSTSPAAHVRLPGKVPLSACKQLCGLCQCCKMCAQAAHPALLHDRAAAKLDAAAQAASRLLPPPHGLLMAVAKVSAWQHAKLCISAGSLLSEPAEAGASCCAQVCQHACPALLVVYTCTAH